MKKEIKATIEINAAAAGVWRILTNFNEYPKWNPFIKSISGNLKVGEKLIAFIHPPGGSGMTFKPKVLVVDNERKFEWLGHFLIPGLFDGQHSFELIVLGNNHVKLIQSEKFSGILLPLFKKMLDNNTIDGFNQMNLKLKELAEAA